MTLSSFITDSSQWREMLTGKHLLFDTDAIISILLYSPTDFFSHIKDIKVTNCIIHPVFAELMSTNDNAQRANRQAFIDGFNFYRLPLGPTEFATAIEIQLYLLGQNCYPSPTDLYLGSILSHYCNNMFFITRNTKDFPYPLYERKGHIIFQDSKRVCTLSLISINKNLLR